MTAATFMMSQQNTAVDSQTVLRLSAVVKRFGAQAVLDGIDLAVAEHEVVVLIGASGSGKSTLLRTINLLETVDDGQIWLRDIDITNPRIKQDEIRARIGVVFQHYNLFPHLTVLENVTLAARHVFKTTKIKAQTTGLELLERIGLRDKADAYPDRLSGGQQQRVAIVRAIATNPELLLLDEVTSALDPQLVGEVLELVRELKRAGTTILMATHEMEFARQIADRVVYLKDGVIIESGTPQQVFEHPQRAETKEFLSRVMSR